MQDDFRLAGPSINKNKNEAGRDKRKIRTSSLTTGFIQNRTAEKKGFFFK